MNIKNKLGRLHAQLPLSSRWYGWAWPAWPPSYVFDAQRTQHIDYGGTDGHIHELWWDSRGWHYNDLTLVTRAPLTISNPTSYVFVYTGTTPAQHVAYNAENHHIILLYWLP